MSGSFFFRGTMKKIIYCLVFVCGCIKLADAYWFWDKEIDKIHNNGNRYSQSFYAVKKVMLDKIYYDNKRTLYCNAEFDKYKRIKKIIGFTLPDVREVDFKVYDISSEELELKAERMEWEHIVPAVNFGRSFKEWSQGHQNCVSRKGKRYKGRICAEQESEDFRYMYTDMYNLYPAIGAVNYLRSNFNFTDFNQRDNVKNIFGNCQLKISRNKVEPDNRIKGLIARTYFYMEQTYSRYKIGEPMRGILKIWDKKYPVTPWECQRAYRIEKVQGNANEIVKKECQNKMLYTDNKGNR